jgi:hypothetical protein
MSELVREYPHIVADPTKEWLYFDIPGCLKMLSWSVDECFGHIWPQYFEKSSLTRHAVVQLALYTCQPFRDTPAWYPGGAEREGYIIDEHHLKNGDKKQHKYPCRSVTSLVEALATALMNYEIQCEWFDGWQAFQKERDVCLKHLQHAKQLFVALKRRGITPEDPTLKHRRMLQSDPLQEVINILPCLTKDDYQRAGGHTITPGDPWTQFNKWILLSEMSEAFRPIKWRKEVTYRALAAIMNQMQIYNAKGGEWTPSAIKTFLARGPTTGLEVRIHLTRPNIVPWYTKPEYLKDNQEPCSRK